MEVMLLMLLCVVIVPSNVLVVLIPLIIVMNVMETVLMHHLVFVLINTMKFTKKCAMNVDSDVTLVFLKNTIVLHVKPTELILHLVTVHTELIITLKLKKLFVYNVMLNYVTPVLKAQTTVSLVPVTWSTHQCVSQLSQLSNPPPSLISQSVPLKSLFVTLDVLHVLLVITVVNLADSTELTLQLVIVLLDTTKMLLKNVLHVLINVLLVSNLLLTVPFVLPTESTSQIVSVH
jgi:hypothetical protein